MQKMTEAEREREHLKDLERLKSFRPIDDDFARCMFRDNLPLAQFVLRIITGKEDLIITKCETQVDMKRVTGARSVCLDAYGTDSIGKKYDLEIERSNEGADPHRARYYSSVIDIENLDAGQDFNELPDTYVIFITEKDIYKKGKALYHFETTDIKTGAPFNDGVHYIYVNGEYRGDDAIGKLMHDFNCSDADQMHYDLMSQKTKYLKENQTEVEHMNQLLEEMKNEYYEKGKSEGHDEGRIEGISHLKNEIIQKMQSLGYKQDEIQRVFN